jgi:hypothetical protein
MSRNKARIVQFAELVDGWLARKPKRLPCHWLAVHFASPEEAAGFYLKLSDAGMLTGKTVRQFKSGEIIRRCEVEE